MAPSMSKIAIIAAAAIVASSSTSTDFRVQQTGAVRLAVRANEPEVAADKAAEEKAAEEKKKLFAHFKAQGKDYEWVENALFEATNEGKEFKNFMPYPRGKAPVGNSRWEYFASPEAKEQWEASKATWDSMAAKLKTITEKTKPWFEKRSEDARAAKAQRLHAIARELPSKVAKYQKDKKAAAIKAAQDEAQRLIDEQADRAQAIKIALIALSIIACPVLLVFLVHWCRSADADEDDDYDYDSEYETEAEEDCGFDTETEAGEVEAHAKMSQLTVAGASTASTFARAKSSTRSRGSQKSAASKGSQKKRVMRV